jgi:ADP-heptose:LPS heptosyltransferase
MKIVLINPYRGIGDLIFHLPLIKGLFNKYNKKIILLTNKNNKAKQLLKNEKELSTIKYVNFDRENTFLNSIRLIKEINYFKPNIVVLSANSKRLVIPVLFCRSQKKIFFEIHNKDISKFIYLNSKAILGKYFKKNYKLSLINKSSHVKNIFINVDSFHDQNNWDIENFKILIFSLLKKRKKFMIYLNLMPTKKKLIKELKNIFFFSKNITFTHNVTFKNLISIINNCNYVISNESGPVCIGASLGKRVFSIYNPLHTPHLSSKIIDKNICYFNSDKKNPTKIIKILLKKIN